MCVGSLLLKFKSNEKQLTRPFISMFAFDSILKAGCIAFQCRL